MRRSRLIIAAVVAAASLSCGSPDEPIDTGPVQDLWSVSFLQLKHDAVATPPYPDSTTFVGLLHHFPSGEWVLELAGAQWTSLYMTNNVDSTNVYVQRPEYAWMMMALHMTAFGDSIAGTYSMATSPHSTTASGTFTGHRQ